MTEINLNLRPFWVYCWWSGQHWESAQIQCRKLSPADLWRSHCSTWYNLIFIMLRCCPLYLSPKSCSVVSANLWQMTWWNLGTIDSDSSPKSLHNCEVPRVIWFLCRQKFPAAQTKMLRNFRTSVPFAGLRNRPEDLDRYKTISICHPAHYAIPMHTLKAFQELPFQ